MRSSAGSRCAYLLLVTLPLLGCPEPETGSLKVVVMDADTGTPMASVMVRLVTTPIAAATSAIGVAQIDNLLPGTYLVRAGVIGLCQSERAATVIAGFETVVHIWLCADVVEAINATNADLIALLDVRVPESVCENDRVIEGQYGVAPVGTNALALENPAPPCRGAAWILSADRAPAFSNTTADFPWSGGLGDIYQTKLPDRRLRVAMTIWLSDLPGYDAAQRADLAYTLRMGVLPKANAILNATFSGMLLTANEAGDEPPEIIDVDALTGVPSPYTTIGKDCSQVDAIKATPALYHSDRINVYYVAGTEVGYAGFTCYSEAAPNIIYMKAGESFYYTLLHEVGHSLGLTRPDWGHTQNLPGFFGSGADGYPSLNLMAPPPVVPDYFSVGQLIRMHADRDSWLNTANSADGSTIRSRQALTATPPFVTACGCPETERTDDCPRLREDIDRPGIVRTSVPSPMACYVRAPACQTLATSSTSFDAKGFADAALTTPGSGGLKVWSLTPNVVKATKSGSTVQVTRVGAGTGRVMVSIGGSYGLVDIPEAACP